MNMITYTARSRAEIVAIHSDILEGLEMRDDLRVINDLDRLERYTKRLAHVVMAKRAKGGRQTGRQG